jgi:hypothetical protein
MDDTNDERSAQQVEDDFKDLRERLRVSIENAEPTESNLHFARLRHVDAHSFTDLTRLAHEGRTRVDEHREFFEKNALYADGMFWYDLCLTISSAALSYDSSDDKPLHELTESLVLILVLISRYTVRFPSDMNKRNHEALGNLLLAADSDELTQAALAKAKLLGDTDVLTFVEQTVRAVEGTRFRNRNQA